MADDSKGNGEKLAEPASATEISPRSLRVWLVFSFTVAVWVTKIFEYFQSNDLETFKAIREFASYLAKVANRGPFQQFLQNWGTGGVFVLLIASQLRIFVGVEFADKADIFEKTLTKIVGAPQVQNRREADIFIQAIIGIELALTVFQSYFIGVKNLALVPGILLAQAFFILMFDKRLCEVYKEMDSGWFFVLTDLFFFCFSLLWFYLAINTFSLPWEGQALIAITAIAFFYLVAFGYELVTRYRKPIVASLAEACKVVGIAYRFFNKKPFLSCKS